MQLFPHQQRELEESWGETFLPVPGYEGLYEISNKGRLWSVRRRIDSGKCHREFGGRFLPLRPNHNGYMRVILCVKGSSRNVAIHRLVAEAFIPNPDNLPFVNHRDGNKQNNCVDNLEWCTASQNMKHAFAMGLKTAKGSNNSAHKLTDEEVDYIRKVYCPYDKKYGSVPLAKKFGVHRKTITRVALRKSWIGGDVNHVENKSV